MKIHVEGYYNTWGFTIADTYISCDIPGFIGCASDDIMHIDPKGMGGRLSVEYPENWMAGVRKLHEQLEGRHKEWLFAANCLKFITFKPNWQWSELFQQTAFFKNHIHPYLGFDNDLLVEHLEELVETLNPF